MSKPLDPHTLRRIAVEALVDPRTVQRFIDGAPVRPSLRERMVRAFAVAGVAAPERMK